MRLKLAVAAFLFFAVGAAVARAADDTPRQTSSDFTTASSSGNVNVSTASWTKVPTSPDTRRWAIMVDNPDTNTGNFMFRIINSDQNPPLNSDKTGVENKPDDPPWILSISGYMDLYAISKATGTEPLFYQELR